MNQIQETLEQRQQQEYDKKKRELQIARMRAVLVREQIVQAYEILENIRFDFLSDTAFRGKITMAKKGCELAIGDFLLDDNYWKDRYQSHIRLTAQEYDEELKNPAIPTLLIGIGSEVKRQSD